MQWVYSNYTDELLRCVGINTSLWEKKKSLQFPDLKASHKHTSVLPVTIVDNLKFSCHLIPPLIFQFFTHIHTHPTPI